MEPSPLRISQWNEQDFENFVRGNSALFRNFTGRFISEKSTVDDIVQDVLLKLWNDRKKLDHIQNYTAFTLTMLKNRSLNFIRKQSKFSDDAQIDPQTYDITDLFNDLVAAQTKSILIAALNSLPEKYAKIMSMTLIGYANDEIATELDISIDSVKSIKKRSMQKFKKILPENLLLLFY